MRKQRILRIGAAVLSAVLTMQGMNISNLALAADKEIQVSSNSQTQMSSEKEVMYVNTYNDTTVRTQNFDSNWKFYLGDAGSAQEVAFDDSKWRSISLPHDYSIEQEYSKSMEAESGYLPGGTGWYRKHFTVGKEMEGKELRIDFDGVYMNATVWVNGEKLGTHPNGYTPFSFDITDYINFGQENIIVVKVDHKTPSSRWYSGSGIYRSVNLSVLDKVHVDLYGTKIETKNLEKEQGGAVNMDVKTTIANEGASAAEVVLTHTVFKKGGSEDSNIGTVTTVAKTVEAGKTAQINATLEASNPTLWSIENPALYTVRTEVKVGGKVVDTYDTEYGFRYFAMNNNTGFTLNGEKVKLKGVSMHHDQGALGSVANKRAIERQVEILKEMGCNSIRVTHNPAASALIEICNEQGILVIDEMFDGWMYAKNGNINDYSVWFNKSIEEGNEILGREDKMTWAEFDLKAAMKRGQNAPSIIMWSLGNEIQEGAGGSGYNTKARDLISWAQEIDTTRILTIGSNAVKNGAAEHVDIANQLTAVGGASGTNYSNGASYDNLHKTYPNWNLYGAETASSVNSRGIYSTKASNSLNADKQLTSYDKSAVGWGARASAAWYDVITRDFVAGEYVWTGFDYIGEPTPANGTGSGAVTSWPSPKSSYFGIVDTAGFPKDSYYFYQSQWNDKVNTLHILPTWNEEGIIKDSSGRVEVVVYSDAAKVELYLNGNKVGEQEFETKTTGAGYTYQQVKGSSNSHENLYMTFNVPYEEGVLEAKAYDKNGKEITDTEGRSVVKTTGEEAKLSASADRTSIKADGKDLTYVTVDVTDKDGNIVPDAANRVTFKVEGNGVLVGVDNGSSPDHDSYKADNRRAFSGKVLAIVQSTKQAGSFTVTAAAEGLVSSSVTIEATAVDGGPSTEKQIDSFYMVKNYYVKTGNMPQLPETITTRYTDGSAVEKEVIWQEISKEQIAKVGSFTVSGLVDGKETVSVNINMIDYIGGLLNYSTATPVGVEARLPESRPAVMADGKILAASFPVEWAEVEEGAYDKVGIVVVKGTANVLGQEIEVSASIRVLEESITIGGSVSGAAKLSQSIPQDMQSDTLNAIKDGSTTISDNNSGGANPTVWSNWKYSQAGNTKASITFEYDTQQRIGQIVMHFAKDSGSMRYPDAGTTEIYISETGAEGSWTKLNAKETIGQENGRVKPYTYDFEPITATFIRFDLTNANVTGLSQKPCMALTEIELKKAQGAFVTNTTAKLEALTVNGEAVEQSALNAGAYSTPALIARVEAKGADNAAVTVLPAYQDTVKVIIESEDHMTQNVFEVKLNQEVNLSPDYSDLDYPIEKLTATAASEYAGSGNEGPARYVLDGNTGTHWHTNWRTTEAVNENKRQITLELQEPTVLDALRYYPRVQGGMNGFVTEYRVEYSIDGQNWTKISEGNWDRSISGWQLAKFTQPVEAKYVRLTGVHTWADSANDAHMSVAELRVRTPKQTTDISDEANNIKVEILGLEEGKITLPFVDSNNPVKPAVKVTKGEETLEWGIDYKVSYENNTAFGIAKVLVEGIINYSGSIEKEFEIVKAEKELTGIFIKSQPEKTAYKAGEVFDPTGLVLTLCYNDKSEEDVAYNSNTAKEFAFSPALDKALEESEGQVKVIFAGKTATIDITVSEAPSVPTVKEELQKEINNAEALNPEDYDADKYAAFLEELRIVKEVYNNPDSTEAELQAARERLAAALEILTQVDVPEPEPEKPNKDALKSYYDESALYYAKEKYSSKLYKEYELAMKKAKAVLEDEKATAKEVEEAYQMLRDITRKLDAERSEMYSGLQKFYEECKAFYQEKNHSKANWKAYEKALKAVEDVLSNKDASHKDLNSDWDSLTGITQKMNKELPTDIVKPNPPQGPDSVKTGDKTPVKFFAATLMASAAVMAVLAVSMLRKPKRI